MHYEKRKWTVNVRGIDRSDQALNSTTRGESFTLEHINFVSKICKDRSHDSADINDEPIHDFYFIKNWRLSTMFNSSIVNFLNQW